MSADWTLSLKFLPWSKKPSKSTLIHGICLNLLDSEALTEDKDDKKFIEDKILIDANTPKIRVGASEVFVTADTGLDLEKAKEAKPFKDWVDAIAQEKRVSMSHIHFQSVDMFGPRVGFIKFKADPQIDGKNVPGIVFMRGGAVAILVILYFRDELYTLGVRQTRVPVASASFLEIPAGMIDDDGNFVGVVAKEMKEETGIVVCEKDLIDMTEKTYKNNFPGMYPSCGASDEFNRIFLYQHRVTQEEINELNGKLTGVAAEGESIKLEILPFEKLWRSSSDAKALAALSLYKQLKKAGELPDPPADNCTIS